ncbi:hypothetical protein N7475_004098 [Penicillium sp. IBT 31633x]|nr:hypothetical protein N7475_004098 [Penicillium sp. IBT 31633x]
MLLSLLETSQTRLTRFLFVGWGTSLHEFPNFFGRLSIAFLHPLTIHGFLMSKTSGADVRIGKVERETDLELDHTLSRRIGTRQVPLGYATMPIIVNDNGCNFDAVVLAGMIGIQAIPSLTVLDGSKRYGEPILDSTQPLSGWLMYRK